jgi:hypothetical protein
MREKIILFLILIAFLGCSKKVDFAKINVINGYWQIKKVEDDNGHKKDYPINEVYDYFKLKNNEGFHKKVKWQPDGSFLVNDLEDKVKIFEENQKIFISFTSKFGNHQEELTSLSDDEMILISNEKVKFVYLKVALNEEKNGQKNK